jgi:hypothetical protein
MDADLRLWLRLLKEIEQLGIPARIGNETPEFELRAIKEMIDVGWLVGSVLPIGSEIGSIYVTDITRVARKAVQDNEPSERRRSFIRNHYRGIASVIAAMAAVLGFVWRLCFPDSQAGPKDKRPTERLELSQRSSPPPASPISPVDSPRP